jgi:hypothetical protein
VSLFGALLWAAATPAAFIGVYKMKRLAAASLGALLISLSPVALSQSRLCPDGSYVDRGPCKLCPDGKYIGGGGACQITPKGDYVRGNENTRPKIAPDGSYTSGGKQTLCPDGTYVAGHQCVLAPNGKYVGKN